MTDSLTSVEPHLELDEAAANFVEHLTRSELLMFIVALVEERNEPGFATDVMLELQDIADLEGDDVDLDDDIYDMPPEGDDLDFAY